MLIQLLPTQVADKWSDMRDDIASALPPTAGHDVNQVLFGLMVGVLQGWILMDEKQEVTKGYLITTNMRDITECVTTLIYCAILLDETASVDVKAEFETLRTYAKSRGSEKIGCFSSNPKLLANLKRVGFTVVGYATVDI